MEKLIKLVIDYKNSEFEADLWYAESEIARHVIALHDSGELLKIKEMAAQIDILAKALGSLTEEYAAARCALEASK